MNRQGRDNPPGQAIPCSLWSRRNESQRKDGIQGRPKRRMMTSEWVGGLTGLRMLHTQFPARISRFRLSTNATKETKA